MKEGGISARKAGLLWGLSMKKSTLQVRLNRRVTFDRQIEVPSPVSFFKEKTKEKNLFADRLIELANRGFGSSTDAFLKSVKEFLDKEIRTIPFNSRSRSPPATIRQLFAMFYFTMLGSQIDLYFWNRLPDYFASAREAYKSLACRNLCTLTLLLLWADTGPAVRILGNIGALQKY